MLEGESFRLPDARPRQNHLLLDFDLIGKDCVSLLLFLLRFLFCLFGLLLAFLLFSWKLALYGCWLLSIGAEVVYFVR